MAPLIDLHMHTLFSDGQLAPKALIEFAKSRGVHVMSVNDHDTVKGVMEMLSTPVEGITVLCGIEMSNTWGNHGDIHITGYFPRSTDFPSYQNRLDVAVAGKRYTP